MAHLAKRGEGKGLIMALRCDCEALLLGEALVHRCHHRLYIAEIMKSTGQHRVRRCSSKSCLAPSSNLLFPFCSLVDSCTALTSKAPMEAIANPAMPSLHQPIEIHCSPRWPSDHGEHRDSEAGQ